MPTVNQRIDRARAWCCIDCGHSLTPSHGEPEHERDWEYPQQRCPTCNLSKKAQQRQAAKQHYVSNRAEGLCGCGAPPSPGYRTCEHCRARSRAQYEARLDPAQRARLAEKRERSGRLDRNQARLATLDRLVVAEGAGI